MSNPKWTMGPLQVVGPSHGGTPMDDGGDYAILDSDGRIIGEAIHVVSSIDRRPAKENAHLWAAAWKLFEALSDMVSDYPNISGATLEYARGILDEARGEGAS